MDRWLNLVGRVLVSLLFLGGAVQKLLDPIPVTEMLNSVSLPGWLIWPVILVNLVGGLTLTLGIRLREWAILLALYCIATSWFHWQLRADPWQVTIVVKNWAIAGGLFILASQAVTASSKNSDPTSKIEK